MLRDKIVVIYGAGGAIGSAVARAFGSEGADLFLTGRRLASVEMVAKDVVAGGGSAEAAEVDALDEQSVDRHLQSVIDKAGRRHLVQCGWDSGYQDLGCALDRSGCRAVLCADHDVYKIIFSDRSDGGSVDDHE